MEWLVDEFRWMQWNWAGTLFFSFLFLSISGLTIWDVFAPGNRRRGFLPMPTTRGDRLFIGIMGSIGLSLLWLAIIGNQALWLVLIVVVLFNIVLALRG